MVAVSPQLPEKSRELIESRKLNFEILFDKDNGYAQKLDLVHGFNDDLKSVYGTFGIDVGQANGNPTWELAIPARLVVGVNHVIKSIEFDADYKVRPEPAATLAMVAG